MPNETDDRILQAFPLCRLPKDEFYQFIWRPRPPSKLTKEQEEDILKNLKKYSKKYDEEDAQIMNAVKLSFYRLFRNFLEHKENPCCACPDVLADPYRLFRNFPECKENPCCASPEI